MPVLSILIPTTPDRQYQFERLYFKLLSQVQVVRNIHPSLGEVEIRYDNSRKFLDGGLSIGKKRQGLLDLATGDYVAFVDSDDDVAPNYIEQLVRGCLQGADIVTFKSFIKNDHYWALIDMSLNNLENEEVNPYGSKKRTPWHICPLKREIAMTQRFNDINHSEDWNWMSRILLDVHSETHLDVVLTQYNHSERYSEADKIIRSQQ